MSHDAALTFHRVAQERLAGHGPQRQNLCVRRFQAADDRRPFLGPDRQFLGIRPRGGFMEGTGANADQARRGRRGRRQWQNLRGRRRQLAAWRDRERNPSCPLMTQSGHRA
jgi:hypothetical protein